LPEERGGITREKGTTFSSGEKISGSLKSGEKSRRKGEVWSFLKGSSRKEKRVFFVYYKKGQLSEKDQLGEKGPAWLQKACSYILEGGREKAPHREGGRTVPYRPTGQISTEKTPAP